MSDFAINFPPHVWGTVGQWVSAIGTSSAFLATFYVIRRDANERRRSQAKKVAVFVVRTPRAPDEIKGKHRTWYDVTVKNLSEEPIYDVKFVLVDDGGHLVDGVGSYDVLLPDESEMHRSPYSTVLYGVVDVVFRDNGGHIWRRSVQGHLTELGVRARGKSYPQVTDVLAREFEASAQARRRTMDDER